MANKIRSIDEKVQPVRIALAQINVEAAAREAGVPSRTLDYDLKKVEESLPNVLMNRKPGPKRQGRATEAAIEPSEEKVTVECPDCGSKTVKNGTYWVLNWVVMLTMGWLGVQKVLIQPRRCKACDKEIGSPERIRQAEARQAEHGPIERLSDVTTAHLAAYLVHLKHQHELASATIGRNIASLKSFFAYAARTYVIPTDPAAILDVPTIESRIPQDLSEPQIERLLAKSLLTTGLSSATAPSCKHSSTPASASKNSLTSTSPASTFNATRCASSAKATKNASSPSTALQKSLYSTGLTTALIWANLPANTPMPFSSPAALANECHPAPSNSW